MNGKYRLSSALLWLLDVEPILECIVVDGNRITASSAINGFEFGSAIASELFGEAIAQETQLRVGYSLAQSTEDFADSIASEAFDRVRVEQQALSMARMQVIRRSTAIVDCLEEVSSNCFGQTL